MRTPACGVERIDLLGPAGLETGAERGLSGRPQVWSRQSRPARGRYVCAVARPKMQVQIAAESVHRYHDCPAGIPRVVEPSGNSSVVEHDLAKVGVAGSNPVSRSSFSARVGSAVASGRRTQVVKGADCKSAMRRFESARRLQFFSAATLSARYHSSQHARI